MIENAVVLSGLEEKNLRVILNAIRCYHNYLCKEVEVSRRVCEKELLKPILIAQNYFASDPSWEGLELLVFMVVTADVFKTRAREEGMLDD